MSSSELRLPESNFIQWQRLVGFLAQGQPNCQCLREILPKISELSKKSIEDLRKDFEKDYMVVYRDVYNGKCPHNGTTLACKVASAHFRYALELFKDQEPQSFLLEPPLPINVVEKQIPQEGISSLIVRIKCQELGHIQFLMLAYLYVQMGDLDKASCKISLKTRLALSQLDNKLSASILKLRGQTLLARFHVHLELLSIMEKNSPSLSEDSKNFLKAAAGKGMNTVFSYVGSPALGAAAESASGVIFPYLLEKAEIKPNDFKDRLNYLVVDKSTVGEWIKEGDNLSWVWSAPCGAGGALKNKFRKISGIGPIPSNTVGRFKVKVNTDSLDGFFDKRDQEVISAKLLWDLRQLLRTALSIDKLFDLSSQISCLARDKRNTISPNLIIYAYLCFFCEGNVDPKLIEVIDSQLFSNEYVDIDHLKEPYLTKPEPQHDVLAAAAGSAHQQSSNKRTNGFSSPPIAKRQQI